jgi:hypothetical protein
VRGESSDGPGPWSNEESVSVTSAGDPIQNGDFESGRDGSWTEDSTNDQVLIVRDDEPYFLPVYPHGGDWLAWLGGMADEVSSITQQVTVPSAESTLSFWYWIASQDTCGNDFGYLRVGDTAIDTFDLCQSENTNDWVEHAADLSAYAGQSVSLQIRGETNSSGQSNFFIDDVAFPTGPAEAPLAQVSGRVVRDGASVGAGIVVELEGRDPARTTTTTTDVDGRYTFDSASLEGTFDVVFAYEWNTQRYTADQVASWAWLEGEAPSDDAGIELPDLEISLEVDSERFEQVAPAAGASFSTGQISPRTPLTFEWTPYSGASFYWVDLGREGEATPVWQSLLTFGTTSSFNGTLNDETSITAGTYWWSVGAQKQIGAFKFFVYGWPRALIIEQ